MLLVNGTPPDRQVCVSPPLSVYDASHIASIDAFRSPTSCWLRAPSTTRYLMDSQHKQRCVPIVIIFISITNNNITIVVIIIIIIIIIIGMSELVVIRAWQMF